MIDQYIAREPCHVIGHEAKQVAHAHNAMEVVVEEGIRAQLTSRVAEEIGVLIGRVRVSFFLCDELVTDISDRRNV